MFGRNATDEELVAWRDWGLALLGLEDTEEATDNATLREGLAFLIESARTTRQWTEQAPVLPGLYWFHGAHVTGDVLFLQPVALEVTSAHEGRVPGRTQSYRVRDLTGWWAGPFPCP